MVHDLSPFPSVQRRRPESGACVLIRARARQLGDRFTLRGFFDELNAAGMMPVSLLRWQLTGDRPAS
jgi:hypothetical protein